MLIIAVNSLIIIASSLTLHILHQPPFYESKESIQTTKSHVALQLIVSILAIYSYFKTYLTSPGTSSDWSTHRPDLQFPNSNSIAPSTPPPKNQHDTDLEQGTSSSVTNNERYCEICKHTKKERVHHCSECGKCILRFDHHCPWMGTCIGLLNIKYFILFLIYTTFACIHTIYIIFKFLIICYSKTHTTHHHHKLHPNVILAIALGSPVALSIAAPALVIVSFLLSWNLWLGSRNETNLECLKTEDSVEKEIEMILNSQPDGQQPKLDLDCLYKEKGKEKEKHRKYAGNGIIQNFRHLFGWNFMLWLLPIKQSRLCPFFMVINGIGGTRLHVDAQHS